MDRAFLVRGKNAVTLSVKPVLLDRLYVCSKDGPEMTVGKEPDRIPGGAILWCVVGPDHDGTLRARSFDNGFYDARRAIGDHVDVTYRKEIEAGTTPERAVEIDRIRERVATHAFALDRFESDLFDSLAALEAFLRVTIRDLPARCAPPDIAALLAESARYLRGISVAPLSRRALPHAANDVDAAIASLAANDVDATIERLSKADRSLRMTFVRRALEPSHAAASHYKATDTAPNPEDRAFLADTLARCRGRLFEDGKPLDHDFEGARIVSTVAPKLSAAIDHLRSKAPYNAAKTLADIDVATRLL